VPAKTLMLTVALAAVLPLGCSGAAQGGTEATSSELATPASPARGDSVAIQTFRFTPGTLDVAAGSRVTWTNEDDIEHTVTAGAPQRETGSFEESLDGAGTTFAFTFGEPGIYPYFCDIHSVMRGTIHVT
jgi:plastocyanin